jgi:hypothetical protein
MKEIVITLVALIVMAIGILAIFDARKISKEFFSSDNQNKNVRVLKIVGTIVVWITLGIIYMIK